MDQRYRVIDAATLRDRLKKSQRRVEPHSVRSLAQIAGVSPNAIQKLLQGVQRTVDAARADRIAAALGVPRDDLFMPELSSSTDDDSHTESEQGKVA